MTSHTLNNFWLKLKSLFNFETKPEAFSGRVYRETYKALSKLSDRELLDIGISRGDIHQIADEYSRGLEVKETPNLKSWS
jgi:uncharacterized protein YjiS (DUF1127 family)